MNSTTYRSQTDDPLLARHDMARIMGGMDVVKCHADTQLFCTELAWARSAYSHRSRRTDVTVIDVARSLTTFLLGVLCATTFDSEGRNTGVSRVPAEIAPRRDLADGSTPSRPAVNDGLTNKHETTEYTQ